MGDGKGQRADRGMGILYKLKTHYFFKKIIGEQVKHNTQFRWRIERFNKASIIQNPEIKTVITN